jgi:hypothetical protein
MAEQSRRRQVPAFHRAGQRDGVLTAILEEAGDKVFQIRVD